MELKEENEPNLARYSLESGRRSAVKGLKLSSKLSILSEFTLQEDVVQLSKFVQGSILIIFLFIKFKFYITEDEVFSGNGRFHPPNYKDFPYFVISNEITIKKNNMTCLKDFL